MPPSADAERIYSVSQLSEALQSGLMGLKDQLQVLSILDGSSTCWPGVSAAQSDLEQLIKLASAHLSELEASSQQLSAANTRLQGQNSQLAAKLKASTSKQQQLQDDLRQQTDANKQLQSKAEAAQDAAQQAQQQLWQLEQSNAQLVQQASKQAAEADAMKRELAGLREHEMQLREQAAVQQEQLAAVKQELAVRLAELSHVSTSLEEHKDSLAHARSQLATVQDNLGGQLRALQRELSATQADKLQSDREVGRLTQEVSAAAAVLEKAHAEVTRLQEWQDVFKRMADDKAQQAAQELQAFKARAAERQVAAAGEVSSLRERLAARDAQVDSLQQEFSLLQLHVREAQRAQGAAAEAQAAAGKALDQQETELTSLRQQLSAAQLALERSRADHAAAESALRAAAAAEREQVVAQLEQAQRDVAVKQALCDGWQRANQVLQDKARQLEAAATSAAATAEGTTSDLRMQLEGERAEARRAKMEASSTIKQYEQLVQRLRREADASAEEVCRLRALQNSCRPAPSGADVPHALDDRGSPHLHMELMQLQRAMHSISGTLQAAEATMEQMASAEQALKASPAAASTASIAASQPMAPPGEQWQPAQANSQQTSPAGPRAGSLRQAAKTPTGPTVKAAGRPAGTAGKASSSKAGPGAARKHTPGQGGSTSSSLLPGSSAQGVVR